MYGILDGIAPFCIYLAIYGFRHFVYR
ncbi:unnamed protein product [Phyllotreta striolata]|uniref:Uncharacterized protein n=1 Tax=Phyllotreta striolata TaxID=444603 RepID=A0A9N9XKX9_PHYSR|nr:unnamed protein product [Phyllotreta striolata]